MSVRAWVSARMAVVMVAVVVLSAGADARGGVQPSGSNRPPTDIEGKDCLTSGCHLGLSTDRFQHGPVAVRACVVCHKEKDHAAHTYELTADPPELCFGCHGELRTDLQGPDRLAHRHLPVDVGMCLNCHDPHGGSQVIMLKDENVSDLCLSCHEDQLSLAGKIHAPIEQTQGCLACHRAHGSAYAKLLKAPGAALCGTCHPKQVTTAAQGGSVHKPVADGACLDCHTPHASTMRPLIKASLSAENYGPFDGQRYALCFTCHAPDLVRAEQTKTATRFRNGARNLHAVHVDRPDGRSCRICHDPHGSAQARLIRPGFPYRSDWTLPIGFTATDTGGSCAGTCHPARRYDRVTPVEQANATPAVPVDRGLKSTGSNTRKP